MGSTKMEIKRFDGCKDFNMWCNKMKAILMQQRCAKALGGEKEVLATMNNLEIKQSFY